MINQPLNPRFHPPVILSSCLKTGSLYADPLITEGRNIPPPKKTNRRALVALKLAHTHNRSIEKQAPQLLTTRAKILLLISAGFALTLLIDIPLVHLIYVPADRGLVGSDSYWFFRLFGYLGTWITVGLLLIVYDRHRHRGTAVLFSAGLAGLIAETVKLIVARERPMIDGVLQDGGYRFRGIFSGFYATGKNLGFPSSHTAVAFGGCFMLAYFFRELRFWLVLLSLGCGVTRMLMGAHYASDVFGGALAGWVAAKIITRSLPRSVREKSELRK